MSVAFTPRPFEWPDIAETAKLLRASRRTIARMLQRGRLRAWRLNPRSRWHVDPTSIEAALRLPGAA